MTLEEIKAAVLAGKTVHWTSEGYVVKRPELTSPISGFVVEHKASGFFTPLTWSDDKTLNGKEEDFYVALSDEERMREALLDLATKIQEVADSMVRNTTDPWVDVEDSRLRSIAAHMINAARS